MKMYKMCILWATVATIASLEYNGLRVKFGWSDALAGSAYFYDIPRTIADVESEGWQRTERPPGLMPELRMYCPPGRAVCPLYDTSGFIAGIMIAIPVYMYDTPVIKPEKMFVKWQAPDVDGETALDYWTATQYFVSEGYVINIESLKAGAGPTVDNGATLQDGGVWVADLDGRLMRIPSTEAELNSTAFKKQNCFPNMGTHYYYNMSKNMKCENLFPWFALTTGGDLVGTGFQIIGRLPRQKAGNWFEVLDSTAAKRSVKTIVPSAPQCLEDWAEKYGVITLHIYYINDPWNIKCRTGDSIQPVPIVDRFLLNGFRYFNQVSDEVAKLFSG